MYRVSFLAAGASMGVRAVAGGFDAFGGSIVGMPGVSADALSPTCLDSKVTDVIRVLTCVFEML